MSLVRVVTHPRSVHKGNVLTGCNLVGALVLNVRMIIVAHLPLNAVEVRLVTPAEIVTDLRVDVVSLVVQITPDAAVVSHLVNPVHRVEDVAR